MYYGPTFRTALHNLRVACPVPAIVRTVTYEYLTNYWAKHKADNDEETPFSDCLDISKGKKKQWLIRIMRGLKETEAIDALVHEWAHAMDEYYNGPPTEIHRNSWGECYSKAHRAVCYPKV